LLGILCMEDIVHEIATAGPQFKAVSNFLCPMKLSNPLGGSRVSVQRCLVLVVSNTDIFCTTASQVQDVHRRRRARKARAPHRQSRSVSAGSRPLVWGELEADDFPTLQRFELSLVGVVRCSLFGEIQWARRRRCTVGLGERGVQGEGV
jgi:hypothetical protein